MKDLLKGVLIGAGVSAVVTASLFCITTLRDVPERGIVQAFRPDAVGAAANPRCAPRPVKMPCLQSDFRG